MVCRMCLKFSKRTLKIFDTNPSTIAQTIARHFWFEPNQDDAISTKICLSCWAEIEKFHLYYLSVEEAQRCFSNFTDLTEVKEESPIHLSPDLNYEPENPESKSPPERVAETKDLITTTYKFELFDNDYKDIIEDERIDDDEVSQDIENPGFEFADDDESPPTETSNNVVHNSSANSEREKNKVRRNNERNTKLHKNAKPVKNVSDQTNVLVSADDSNDAEQSAIEQKDKEIDDEISAFMKIQCHLCSEECKNFTYMKNHYRRMHKENGFVMCCTRKFHKRTIFYDHIQTHKNPDAFKCSFCDKSYNNSYALKNHLATHDADLLKFKCDKCPRTFAKEYRLNKHKIMHIPKEEHLFACDVCGKRYPTKNTMETHRKAMHELAYSKICDICGKAVHGKTYFEMHLLEHDDQVDSKTQCNQCGMWLKNPYRLKIHIRRNHLDKKEGGYSCEICEKNLTSALGLKRHMQNVHCGERNNICSICSKGFQTALCLKEHMTTHTGKNLYECQHCSKTFRMRSNWHSHRKKMHRKEWEESRISRGLPVETKARLKGGVKSAQLEMDRTK